MISRIYAWFPFAFVQLHFKLRFDLRGYGPDDIHVDTANNRLTVHAKKTVKSADSTQMREFCRTVYLPDKVDVDKFASNLTEVSGW